MTDVDGTDVGMPGVEVTGGLVTHVGCVVTEAERPAAFGWVVLDGTGDSGLRRDVERAAAGAGTDGSPSCSGT